jgi:cytochrome c-type biogenesis protein CcmH/NrfF
MGWIAPVVVALIGGPLMWLLTRFDKRNTEQHGENLKVLNRIESKVDRVDQRIDEHIEWHFDQSVNERKGA